jgi:multidrug resistance efflux pump
MKNYLPLLSARLPERIAAPVAVALLVLIATATACQSSGRGDEGAARGVVIVNAPATGEVRRVLVREGTSVEAGAPIVEIAVRVESPAVAPTAERQIRRRVRAKISGRRKQGSRRPEPKRCVPKLKCNV